MRFTDSWAGFISLWLNPISQLLDISEVLRNPGEAPPGFQYNGGKVGF